MGIKLRAWGMKGDDGDSSRGDGGLVDRRSVVLLPPRFFAAPAPPPLTSLPLPSACRSARFYVQALGLNPGKCGIGICWDLLGSTGIYQDLQYWHHE